MSTVKRIKLHHYMVHAKLVLQDKDNNIRQREMNTLITSNHQSVDFNMMEEARISCFNRLAEETQDPHIHPLDFLFCNISYLGHMTKEQFGAPDGTNKQ